MERFWKQQGRIAGEVIEGDPFATALVELVRANGTWQGRPSELLSAMLPAEQKRPHEWPKTNAVTGRLKRLVPALAAVGIKANVPNERSNRGRIITLEGRRNEPSQPSPKGAKPDAERELRSDNDRDDRDDRPSPRDGSPRPSDDAGDGSAPGPVCENSGKNGPSDGSDDCDGLLRLPSSSSRRKVRL